MYLHSVYQNIHHLFWFPLTHPQNHDAAAICVLRLHWLHVSAHPSTEHSHKKRIPLVAWRVHPKGCALLRNNQSSPCASPWFFSLFFSLFFVSCAFSSFCFFCSFCYFCYFCSFCHFCSFCCSSSFLIIQPIHPSIYPSIYCSYVYPVNQTTTILFEVAAWAAPRPRCRRSWVTSALAWSQERWPELGRIRRGLAAWKLLQDWGLGTWGPGDGVIVILWWEAVSNVSNEYWLIWGWLMGIGVSVGWGLRFWCEQLRFWRLKLCCQGLLGDQDNTILSFQDSVGLPAVQHGHLRQPRVSERLG